MIDTAYLKNILKEKYQLDVEIFPLNGYEDQNFLLRTGDQKKYIAKLSPVAGNASFFKAQIAVADHLQSSSLNGFFQKYISNIKGEKITKIHQDEETFFLRVLSFLEGEFWYRIKEKDPSMFKNLGGFLGKMDRELSQIQEDAFHRFHDWDINRALVSEKKLHYIKDHEKRRLVSYFLLQFQTEVLPEIYNLRYACIHGDVNDYNILVKGKEISGLIDFGDMVWSLLINNLAIACAYAMLETENPLDVATTLIKEYHQEYPLLEKETDLLYYLIASRLCISVCHSAEQSFNHSENEHHFLTENSAYKLLFQLLSINPIQAQDCFRKACGFPGIINWDDDESQLLEKRKTLIGKNLSLSYQHPLKIIKGALQYLYDDKGNSYIDCVNNVSHLGHCHPSLVKSMQKQLAILNTNTRYLNDALVDYAKALTAKLPKRLSVCYFVNSGSEANDLAIRMARHYTKRKDVIVLDHAYHGTSTLAIEMSPYKFDGKGGSGQQPYIHKAISPDLYRGKYQYGDDIAGEKYASSVLEILKDLNEKKQEAAAFICETLLGVGGQIPLPENYLQKVYASVRKFGGVCIADEVQVGFGRVGKTFWGFELQDVEPDIVVLGKPIGNGHPLAAVVVTEEIANAFNNGMEYFNTFGGNPVSMVTGLSVLTIIEEEELQKHALETGKVLLVGLCQLKEKYEIIGDVRGSGLFVGAEFVKDRKSKEPAKEELNLVIEKMKENGFLLSSDGPLHNILKIKPPMVFSQQNAKEMISTLDKVLSGIL